MNGILKKLIGFEIELGCHLCGLRQGTADSTAAEVFCRACDAMFGISRKNSDGCGRGLTEFGIHLTTVTSYRGAAQAGRIRARHRQS